MAPIAPNEPRYLSAISASQEIPATIAVSTGATKDTKHRNRITAAVTRKFGPKTLAKTNNITKPTPESV